MTFHRLPAKYFANEGLTANWVAGRGGIGGLQGHAAIGSEPQRNRKPGGGGEPTPAADPAADRQFTVPGEEG